MTYEVTAQNKNGIVKVILDSNDIESLLLRVKEIQESCEIIKIKKIPTYNIECVLEILKRV